MATVAQAPLFVSGQGGYHTYRIPALVAAPDGTVLAFCEGRRNSASDTGEINLLVRRSTDAGRTWDKPVVIASDGPHTVDNPCPVVDQDTGVVWLHLTHNLGHDTEAGIMDGTSGGTRTAWVMHSEDSGTTWSERVEITEQAKAPDWTWYASGPGCGIQTTSGRLVMPCDNASAATKGLNSHIVYSDDHGRTWNRSAATPSGSGANECHVIERRDGSLLMNVRRLPCPNRCRGTSTSNDGGLTWSDVADVPTLVDPGCQASMIRYDALRAGDLGNRVLFANAASTEARVNMTVRLSFDDGGTWPSSHVLHAGPSAYSSLIRLPDGTVGCLYECGADYRYETLTFARLPIDILKSAA